MSRGDTPSCMEPTQEAGRLFVRRDLLLLGAGGTFLIGPADERWDVAMLVGQASVASLVSFAGHADHLAGLGHRKAAVADSRLLPRSETTLPREPDGARS